VPCESGPAERTAWAAAGQPELGEASSPPPLTDPGGRSILAEMISPPDDEVRTIRVGITVPDGHEAARAMRGRLDAFCEALGAAIRSPVEPHGVGPYRDLLDAMNAGAVDLAWLPPVIALRATARGRTIPVALPVRGGASMFSSALFARAGSNLKSPKDLVAVRAAWVDRQSAAGHLVIRASLRSQGIDLDRAFSGEMFTGSHEGVVQAVQSGAVDVGATFAHLDASGQRVLRAGWGSAAMQVIAFAGPIPADVVAASIRMEVSRIRAVQRALCDPDDRALKSATEELFGAEGFVEARSEHLAPLNRLLGYLEDPRHDSSIPPPPR
jgi:phosphonate transport system substrate-binding protein